MRYLTIAQVLFIHMRLIAETGGGAGVRDLGLLAAAIARPQATFDGEDLYPDLVSKAAAMMDSLVRSHPFLDGNKRVGITAAALFLQLNGARWSATQSEVETFALQVARSELTVKQIADWFDAHMIAK